MDVLRNRLLSKIDDVLARATASKDTPTNTEIHFEARLVSPGFARTETVVLETVKLDEFKQYLPSPDLRTSENPERHALIQDDGASPSGSDTGPERNSRRKLVGGLRLSQGVSTHLTPPRTPTPTPPGGRQLHSHDRAFPKRRRVDKSFTPKLEQSTVDKLIEGIWEQIHDPKSLAMGEDLQDVMKSITDKMGNSNFATSGVLDFHSATQRCRQISSGSRTVRALEVIVQAHWVDCYEARLATLTDAKPFLRPHELKKVVLTEACATFSWSERELRNRMAIWKGYREIRDVAGWSALVFAGPGIYRFCKYRLGFNQEALFKFRSLRNRAEVAADTLKPQWRELLAFVGDSTQIHWRGHPHDWTVGKRKDPVPLAHTYREWDPNFSFEHLEDAVIDKDKWGNIDPRRSEQGPEFYCKSCSKRQSLLAEENGCECFPDLYSPNPRKPCPVQIFQTEDGRNNGLIACCTFERGVAVGEFIGLITKDLNNVDVMQSQAGSNEPYQIFQGRSGNYTRFINHSCQPNCQFQTFTWLGIQRIIIVSKGVLAGKEFTVDYSGRYWQHLDKVCLCGESCCRYKNRLQHK